MSRFIFATLLCLTPALAFAHPHGKTDENSDVDVIVLQDETATLDDVSQSLKATIERHSDDIERAGDKIKIMLKRDSKKIGDHAADDLSALTDGLEALAESDLLTEMMDMLTDLTDDIDVESSDAVTVLRFDGKTIGRVEKDENDRISLSGLGKNLSIDRETVTEDGETKTRIIIEMDGGEDLEIDLPKKR